MPATSSDPMRIAVIGGGAAGIFAAISAAEANEDARIVVFEKSGRFLSKVKVSGGGRCNVTHACFDPKELTSRYPRGARELLGPFHRWQPSDMMAWLEARDVELKAESDGRVFPVTDSSQTIIDCLLQAAREYGVELRAKTGVASILRTDSGKFELISDQGESTLFERVILTTGGGRDPSGHSLATSLGHRVTELAPSLFTFHIQDPRLEGLQGLSVEAVTATCKAEKLQQNGPLLITHWGLSGPAILKLSAWGARVLARKDYQFDVEINWIPPFDQNAALEALAKAKQNNGAKQIASFNPFPLPRRIWERLLAHANLPPQGKWAQASNAQLQTLAQNLVQSRFQVIGKSMNKEEFVTCGGVTLNEIDFKRMESKLVSGLFFAGETLDIDGVTGGFNFQAAWTTGRIAGTAAARA